MWGRRLVEGVPMSFDLARTRRPGWLPAATFALVAVLAGTWALTWASTWPAAAQTSIKFSLDGRLEGLAATLLVPQDRGYFKAAGLDVTVDEASNVTEPITRVASGA